MENFRIYSIFVAFYFIVSCHGMLANDKMAFIIPSSVNNDQLRHVKMDTLPNGIREKRSLEEINLEFFNEQDDTAHDSPHHLTKREAVAEPEYFTHAYCKTLGYCGLEPKLSTMCLIKCNFDNEMLLKPFLGLIPELPMTLCQTVNTVFSTLPQQVHLSKLPNLNAYLSSLNVKADDEADFAKTAANALTVTMIKNVRCPIFDSFKPAIKKLEIHDTDKKIRKTVGFLGKLVGSLLGTGTGLTGQFVNPKCDKTNLDDEALLMISAMKTRKCVMDILMPGYFVFNAAPKVASNRKIAPLLRAWNMPLVMFTGVKCCMVQYALHKFRSKCTHKYNLLENPHGLPPKTGPETVCDSIPVFSPIYFATLVKPYTPEGASGNSTGKDTTKPGETTTTTTESPCVKNTGNLEECATESSAVDYSEETTEANAESITNKNEEIGSDEIEY